ncbi:hypothetical protein [Candidatus Cardinium hertigii]|uniref:hypothetical protein n=1 Tax=Candidatus Cardinium hertigii TaxID=247481 RepID=UPI00161C5C66|nr:hypothetical protein [Candidatus Cardinium hertigii]
MISSHCLNFISISLYLFVTVPFVLTVLGLWGSSCVAVVGMVTGAVAVVIWNILA